MESTELYHHGIKGQRWGIRRYQNKDGTLTAAGKEKLDKYKDAESQRVSRRLEIATNNENKYRAKMDKKRAKLEAKGRYQKADRIKEISKEGKKASNLAEAREALETELKAVKNMKFEDMQREIKLAKNDAIVEAAMMSSILAVTATNPISAAARFTGGMLGSMTADKLIKPISASVTRDRLQREDPNRYGKKKKKRRKTTSRIIKDNNNYQNQRAAQLAVQEANRAASLGITGGTNPYMFG